MVSIMRTHKALLNSGGLALSCFACVLVLSCGNAERWHTSHSPSLDEPRLSEVRPTAIFSGGLVFDALVHSPAQSGRNDWGVVLIGGGSGNDLDWTVPGTIASNGSPLQLTINGQSHADAPILSQALVAQGFTVLRWSTIARGDPLAEQWPAKATPRSLADLTDQARSAIEELNRSSGIASGRIMLVGHSLGAARACTIAAEDSGVRALVLLSPAYFTNEGKTPPTLAEARMRFGEEVVRERGIPCLALFGAADTSQAVNSAYAKMLAGSAGFERLDVRIIDGAGHQLGPQQGHLIGPISTDTAAELARWASDAARFSF